MLYFRDREQMLKLLTFSSNRGKLTDVSQNSAMILMQLRCFPSKFSSFVNYDPLPYGYLDRGKYFCNCRPLYQITIEDFFFFTLSF